MDFVWIAAIAVLWVLVTGMVVVLNKLGKPAPSQGERS